MAAAEAARRFAEWWALWRFDVDPYRHVTISTLRGDTVVEIEHVLPSSPYGARWRVTTTQQHLPERWFPPRARATILAAHSPEENHKGRAIYCVDVTRGGGEVVAAVRYHIPRKGTKPLVVMAIALRRDKEELWQESLVGARLAKRYVHALSRRLHRRGFVDYASSGPVPSLDLASLEFLPLDPPHRRASFHLRQYDE